jgi:hypothetical protein
MHSILRINDTVLLKITSPVGMPGVALPTPTSLVLAAYVIFSLLHHILPIQVLRHCPRLTLDWDHVHALGFF